MDLWARTFNAIKDIVTIQDKDLKIIRANKATYQFFQVENGTLTGKHCYEVFTGKTEPCAGCPLLVTIRNGIDHETIIKHENLNKVFRISSSLIPDENSEEEYLVHIARDITKDLESKYIIRESNKRFAKAFKSNPAPMAISEIKSGVFVDVNQQWIEMLGFERLELIDKTSEEVGIWEDIADREGLIATLCAKGAVKEYPIVLRARTGESRSVLWSAEVITVDGRDLMLSLVNDITEHRKNEQKRSIFLELLNNAGHIVVFKDQQLRYVLINQAYTTLTGHALADVIGKTDREVFEGISAPDHIDAYITNDRHALALPQGQSLTEEEHMLASDGSTRTFLTKKFPVYAQDGQLLGVGTITSEITKLKQVEQALRESEERARLLSDLTMEGIVIHKQAVAIEINSSMARMLGFLREELLGKNFMGFFHKEDLPKVRENIKKEYAAPYTVRMTRKNGEYFFAEIESHNFKQNGEVWRVSAIRDITERKRLEDALRENEFFFRESQRIGFIGSYAANFVTGYWKSSEVLDQIFGIDENYTRSVQGWLDIIHPDDRAMMNKYLEREVIAQKKPFNKEYRIIRRSDGITRWVKGYGNVESGADGNVISMIGTIQDITERKQSERSLQEREAYYRSLFNNSLIGVTVTDKNFVISDANDAFLNMLGYSRREFVGKMTISDISHPDDATKSLDMLNKLKRNDIEYFALEKRYISKTGEIVPSLIYVKGIYDDSGEYNGTSSAILDITERKRAEDMLAENEAKYRALFNNSEIAMFVSKIDGTETLEANQKFLDLVGKTREEVIGKPSVILWGDPEERKEMVRQLVDSGSVSEFEFKILNEQKGIRNCVTSLKLYRETGLLEGSIIDITERKQAEEEKEMMRVQLYQSQKMESVGQLAGGVAHDFNNMLGVILGHAEMAMDEIQTDHPVYSDLTEIKVAAERSASIVRQLLAFARKQVIAPKIIDLNAAVEGMLKMMRRLIGEDLGLVWKPGVNLWQVNIDPSQVDQILANLCVNARDAMPSGGSIVVQTENHVIDEENTRKYVYVPTGDYVLLSIGDTGTGIPTDLLAHIFEPFYTTKEVGKGTGLGLSTVYGIVKQNNGFIDVESKEGQGTTFRIYLPRHTLPKRQVNVEKESGSVESGNETILLVEDEPSIIKMASTMLERLGYKVLPAGIPNEAIRLAKECDEHIHLLITDVVMPEMNGKDMAETILKDHPGMKCLFMSGYSADTVSKQGVLEQGINFIQKPFSKNEFADKVRKVLTDQYQFKFSKQAYLDK